MSSFQPHEDAPVFRVIIILHLCDSIAQHLRPRDALHALQTCRDFYTAFLSYRWRTLESEMFAEEYHQTIFPDHPTPEVESALVSYGAGFVRHINFSFEQSRLCELLLENGLHCSRLQSIRQHGHLEDELLSNRRMHWWNYEGICEHNNKIIFTPWYSTTIPLRTLVLNMAYRNSSTIQSLILEAMSNPKEPLTFLTELTRVIPLLENLEVLKLGCMPWVTAVNTFLHLPPRVKDLALRVCQKVTKEFDQEWETYQGGKNGGGNSDGIGTEEASWRAVWALKDDLTNMASKASVTKLSLVSACDPDLLWIVYEMLGHCPNLRSLRLPYIYESRVDDFFSTIATNWPGKLEELDLSKFAARDWEYAYFLETLFPHHEETREESRAGLRSITLHGEYRIRFKDTLVDHDSTLERISVFGCGQSIRSWDILAWLENCPRLDTLLMFDTCELNPEDPSPTVSWSEFQRSGNGTTADQSMTSSLSSALPSTASPLVSSPCPWACVRTLRVLSLYLHIKATTRIEDVPALTEGVYRRLGQLEALEDLALGCETASIRVKSDGKDPLLPTDKEFVRVTLNCSLDQGLGHMASLKKLRRLNVEMLSRIKIGQAEREWMKKHWPLFETLHGAPMRKKW